jgi:ribosomal protein S18 acetylase RimI-like enzyme
MIRLARVKDAPAVHALLWAARADIPLAPTFTFDLSMKWVRDECRGRRVWIDERDNQLAGFMALHVTEIFYLVTAEGYRRQGVAEGFIDHAIAIVHRSCGCGVEARAHNDNKRSPALLRKKGFRVHPTRASDKPDWTVYAFGKVN